MKKLKTNDDLINSLPEERAQKIHANALKEAKKYWGGHREGSGRKKKDENNVLKFQIRVSKREKDFLSFARSHNINYEDLMQG